MKPGQFTWINGGLYRAKKRENNCEGCALEKNFKCPNIGDKPPNYTIDCIVDNVILIKA